MATHGHRSHVDESRPSKTRKIRIPSFTPGEVVLLVKSSQDAVNSALSIESWLNELSAQVTMSNHQVSLKQPKPDTSNRPTIISVNGNSVTSLVQILVDDGKAERDVVLEVVNQLNERVGPIGQNITFMAASPNWLLRSAIHGFGDGGPGGLPIAVTAEDVEKRIIDENALNAIRAELGKQGEITDSAVNVVILDTAYSRQELNDHLNGEYENHSLLKTLYIPSEDSAIRNPASKLQIYEAKDKDFDIELPPTPEDNPHYYEHKGKDNHKIKDHGLFIAGIIHSWAPEARIYLFEVLNLHGVCTLTGLAQALEKVRQMFPSDVPLIVNCSFCVTFPEPIKAKERHAAMAAVAAQNKTTVVDEQRYEKPESALAAMESKFQTIRDAYKDSGVLILAAAGNDAHEDAAPATRYPAAFKGVIGVGASDKHGNPAPYSNPADVEPYEGLMIPGGMAREEAQPKVSHTEEHEDHHEVIQGEAASDHDHSEKPYITDKEDSPIGIYLGEFPEKTKPAPGANVAKGWAAWSGTSFATAMLSGIAARLASEGYKISGSEASRLLTAIKNNLPPNPGSVRGSDQNVASA